MILVGHTCLCVCARWAHVLTGESPKSARQWEEYSRSKGVHREVESEERVRQNSGLLHLRLNVSMRLRNKSKFDNCTELHLVFMEQV